MYPYSVVLCPYLLQCHCNVNAMFLRFIPYITVRCSIVRYSDVLYDHATVIQGIMGSSDVLAQYTNMI